MDNRRDILAAKGGFLKDTFRESGIRGCARKIAAAIKMSLPLFALGRRTNASVGAYFDLITDDARMFYGDSFHFGYFRRGDESFAEALDNHTDAVAEMAGVRQGASVLDLGCGICAPAVRIAKRTGCRLTCVNISREQVRQGLSFVKEQGLSHLIEVSEGNAFELDYDDGSFDSILCIEVAGDMCVTEGQKPKLAAQMHRMLRPGGRVGFSDLVFKARPTRAEERAMRAILYHEGEELITDWPSIFQSQGFCVEEVRDILPETMKTWEHSLGVYEQRYDEVCARYGRRIADRTMRQLTEIPHILQRCGAFLLMSAQRPSAL